MKYSATTLRLSQKFMLCCSVKALKREESLRAVAYLYEFTQIQRFSRWLSSADEADPKAIPEGPARHHADRGPDNCGRSHDLECATGRIHDDGRRSGGGARPIQFGDHSRHAAGSHRPGSAALRESYPMARRQQGLAQSR